MTQQTDWHSVLKEHFFRCYAFWERNNKNWMEAWVNAKREVRRTERHPFKPLGEPIPKEERMKFIQWIREENGNIRRCSVCGRPMTQGYYLDGSYACSDDCSNEWYMAHGDTKGDKEAAIKEYYQDNEQADSEYYWTDWEEQHFYFD